MLLLKHKVFRATFPRFSWRGHDFLGHYEIVRRHAEEFAGTVGVENVVSIAEQSHPHFAVVVWYRDQGPR
jgi:hypothetical protein